MTTNEGAISYPTGLALTDDELAWANDYFGAPLVTYSVGFRWEPYPRPIALKKTSGRLRPGEPRGRRRRR